MLLRQVSVKPDWWVPAGLVQAVEEAARAKRTNPSRFITELLDKRFPSWLPPDYKREWCRRERESLRRWPPRIYTRKREGG